MQALVVYESMFGNTEEVAHAVADGLSGSMDVSIEQGATSGPPSSGGRRRLARVDAGWLHPTLWPQPRS